jgi:putative flippase GtrA
MIATTIISSIKVKPVCLNIPESSRIGQHVRKPKTGPLFATPLTYICRRSDLRGTLVPVTRQNATIQTNEQIPYQLVEDRETPWPVSPYRFSAWPLRRMRLPARLPGTEFGRYLLVGGVAFVADFLALWALVSLAGLHYLPATALAFVLGVWVNYRLSIRWVFIYRAIRLSSVEFVIFLTVGIVGLGVSLGAMSLFAGWLGMHYLLAKALATMLTLLVNFGGRKLLLFTRWNDTPAAVSEEP